MPNLELIAELNLETDLCNQGGAAATSSDPESTGVTETAGTRRAMPSKDTLAKQNGWLVVSPGEFYNAQLAPGMEIFVEKKQNNRWEAWRETWSNGKPKSFSYKIIARDVSFQEAIKRATEYGLMIAKSRRKGAV